MNFIRGAGDLRLGPRPAGGPTSSLLTDLVSYWTMNETSGSRADSTGLNTLTDNNTVVGSAGKIGNAADFVAASNEFLSKVDTDGSLDGGDTDFTFALWLKTTAVVQSYVFTKSQGGDYGLLISAAGILRWQMTSFTRDVLAASAANDGNWHHVVVWHNSTTQLLHLALDNGVVQNSTLALTVFGPTNDPFRIASDTGGANLFTGSVDEMGLWRKLLTSTERTTLWNSGAGLTYPFS